MTNQKFNKKDENRYIMILDTETANGLSNPMVYDIGYVVYDMQNREPVVLYNKLIKEVWEIKRLMNTAYYSNKIVLYQQMLENDEIQISTFNRVMNNLVTTINKYQIKGIYAFNSPFDKRAINSTAEMLLKDNKIKSVEWFDIQGNIKPMVTGKSYKNWIDENKLYAASKRYYSANAENVYRYITQNSDFVEDHTALSDAKIETSILIAMIEHYDQKINFGYKPQKRIKRDIELDKKTIILANGKKIQAYYNQIVNDNGKITFSIN